MKFSKRKRWKIFLLVIFILLLITVADFIRISNYTSYPLKPKKELICNENKIYYDLVHKNDEIDWNTINGTLTYIQNEYDCADFKLVNLIRIIHDFDQSIPHDYKNKINEVLFGFRYWSDEPGENSMCYWSENHQILFSSAEYLIGQKFPDAIFTNNGMTGKQHKEKAKTRILDWLKMRWDYGFSEFYSSVYYKEDIAALINLIDYAKDEEIIKKCKIILDLLFYDVASQSTSNMFVSVSGRAYAHNRKGGTLKGVTEYYWGDGKPVNSGLLYGLMNTKNYQPPEVFKKIATDTSNSIIKQSNGLDLSELQSEGFNNTNTPSMMMQWGMEAFSNPEVVRNSLSYIRANNMFTNTFLEGFKTLDYSLIKWLHLEPYLIKQINPQSNGVTIQKGNTYTYRTKDYSLYTVQNHHARDYASQHHVFGMNIKNNFAIFHNHPATTEQSKVTSPSYWVGYGHLPHSVQDKNINLSIYNTPKEKGIMEMNVLDFTHAYFPKSKFDSIVVHNNYVFGKKNHTYCVFIGTNDLKFKVNSDDDIIQKGKQVFWITEASSKTEDGTFKDFINRIKSNDIKFNSENLELIYVSNSNTYSLKFNRDFKVNNKIINTNYIRYDSPYAKANRKSKTLKFECNGESLYLDFDNMLRVF